ncbi:hypothetical protein [Polymorphospora rubra]|uniref:hypothetical protein n=1 Tax=Polymorphospora rubra TaxID=338584 RepID=UPI0033C72043
MHIDDQGRILLAVDPAKLALNARSAYISLLLGQWGDSPRHDPSSDSPHGFATHYEWLSPSLPESDPLLRFWMDRLRIVIAGDHDRWAEVAAWAYDLYLFGEEHRDRTAILEGLSNLAVAMSRLGYKNTARNLYQRMLADERVKGANQARVHIRYGGFLWHSGDRAGAEEQYDAAVDMLTIANPPNAVDRHELVRGLRRRADARLRRGAPKLAAADLDLAFRTVEQARTAGGYESYRSVDASVIEDLRHLVRLLGSGGIVNDTLAIVGALYRLGNSSAAAVVRAGQPVRPARESVYLSVDRADIRSRAQLGASWAPVTDSDVATLLNADHPVLMIASTGFSGESTNGLTVLCGAGGDAIVHRWHVEGPLLRTLNELLSAPPGTKAPAGSIWTRPWDTPELLALSEAILPVAHLAARPIADGIRIVPLGEFWRFPFAAVPIGGVPAGHGWPVCSRPGSSSQPSETGKRPMARTLRPVA